MTLTDKQLGGYTRSPWGKDLNLTIRRALAQKRDPHPNHTLLLTKPKASTTWSSSLTVYEIKPALTTQPRHSREIKMCSPQDLCTNVHCGSIHSGPRLETARSPSPGERMNKHGALAMKSSKPAIHRRRRRLSKTIC